MRQDRQFTCHSWRVMVANMHLKLWQRQRQSWQLNCRCQQTLNRQTIDGITVVSFDQLWPADENEEVKEKWKEWF